MILCNSVSLLTVGITVSSTAVVARRSLAASGAHDATASDRMVKVKRNHILHNNAVTSLASNTTTSSDTVKLYLGALGKLPPHARLPLADSLTPTPQTGACYKSGSNDTICVSPSFPPIFDEVYTNLSIPNSISASLPTQFPLAPTALFVSLILLACGFLLSLGSSSVHHVNRFERARKHAARVRKWQLGLVVELRDDVAALTALDVADASASLGAGFGSGWSSHHWKLCQS